MKKSILLIMFFSASLMYTMKNDHFNITLYGTTINVSKEMLCNVADTVDILIVGRHQQQLLNFSPIAKFDEPGKTKNQAHFLYIKKDLESDSDDETYKPFEEENRASRWKNVHRKKINLLAISITEPRIIMGGWHRSDLSNELIPNLCYNKVKKIPENQHIEYWTFYGDQAIIEASKDLADCYDKVLMISSNHNSIALSTLGADVGFPREKAAPIAIARILRFISCNPGKYTNIELPVKKRSDFTRYIQILDGYRQKPCLLYCAHKNNQHFLFNVPREIIDYILQLMHCAYIINL